MSSPQRPQNRAPFIVIEGLDRSGKTTQTSLLQSRLESELGVRTQLIKFPDRTTPIGKMIDSYLRSDSDLDDHVIHLLFSANRWELASTIVSLLNEGTTVICDRYAFSGIAFSASKVVEPSSDSLPSFLTAHASKSTSIPEALQERPTPAPKLPYEWCRAPDIGLPAPDLTIFLDISASKAKERGGYGEERYEKEEMQKRVREVFDRLGKEVAASESGPSGFDLSTPGTDSITTHADSTAPLVAKWRVVDAGRDVTAVSTELWKAVYPLVLNGTTEPIRRLWADQLR